jgi:hypothetical protein
MIYFDAIKKNNFSILKKNIYILSFFFLINSCGLITVNGSFQGLYSYFKNTKTKYPNLFVQYNDSFTNYRLSNNGNSKIILITGIELNKCLSQHSSSIVYIWSPNCRSKFCPSLEMLQRKCNDKQIELYIVAETFDVKMIQQKHKITRMLFGINTEYYKTNLTLLYLPKFIKEMEKANKKDNTYNRLFYFKNGQFIKSVFVIEDL